MAIIVAPARGMVMAMITADDKNVGSANNLHKRSFSG
jgi:hypothetical protein